MKKVSKILLGSILCILMITLGFGFNSQAAIDCTITFEEGEGGSEYFVIVDENGNPNIDVDDTRISRNPIDIKIPLNKESAIKIFNSIDYELEWAIEYLNS